MKEKIKSVLFSASIFYSVLIVCLMIFTCITMTDSVELYDNDDNKVKLNNYKEIVSNMEDNECKKVINDIIKYYEDTSYNGSVNLKEMYDYDGKNGLLSYYIKAKDACKNSGFNVDEQLVEVNKLSKRNNNATANIQDYIKSIIFNMNLNLLICI